MLFTRPNLSGDGLIIKPSNYNPNHDQVGIWDTGRLEYISLPKIIGRVPNAAEFDNTNIRVLDLPIKFPGSNEYRIPTELKQFIPTIQECLRHEHNTNPYIDQYYAYLTVDSGYVNAGRSQRRGGYHVDGFQGARITKKVLINRSYITYNNTPAVFSLQPFKVSHLNDRRDNFFTEFDRQANPNNEWAAKPYEIVFSDAYGVHKADRFKTSQHRVFLRLSYDVKIFDRLGNTHNPLFNYDWVMVERNIRKALLDNSV